MKNILLGFCYLTTFSIYAQINNQAKWQQNVGYNIQVVLDDEKHVLNAYMELQYTNNSPSDLNEIWFHLWPNAYKNNNTAFAKQQIENNSTEFYFAKERERGYIDSLNFKVEGEEAMLSYHPDWIDVAKLSLPKTLKTGQTITITTPFRVKIPGSYSRLGHVENSYQVTQWYPKPAVFDINGWNYFPYLDQGEFYSEFGTFDVAITLPQNYVVAATGELLDTTEQSWLKERILYYKGADSREDKTASSALLKTVHFKQNNIHDFAWFADKEFYVFESEQMLKDSSKKVKTYFYSTSTLHSAAVEHVNEAIKFYSDKVGNYPYSTASGVVGPLKAGGGMEYPMITVLASADKTTIVHEIGHNWFYGILGSNERRYPWMDESINTYFENRQREESKNSVYKKNYADKYTAKEKFGDGLALLYASTITKNMDQATNLHSADYTSSNYGGIIYGKGAFSFGLLHAYLGDSTFDSAMQNYFNEWKFKHPLPLDLKHTLEQTSNKNLDWFFDDVLGSTKTYDYKIARIRFKKSSKEDLVGNKRNYQVLVKNTGQIVAPFQITTLNKGNIEKQRWESGFVGKKWIDLPGTERLRNLSDTNLALKEARRVKERMAEVSQVVINLENPLPELNIHNNRIKTAGVLKKLEKIAIGGANHLDRRTTPSIIPLINYNYYDNMMYGGVVSNIAHWERRFHYYAAGFYSNHLKPLKYELYANQMFRLRGKSAYRLDVYGKAASFGHNPNLIVSSYQMRSTYTRLNIGTAIFFKKPSKPYSRVYRKLDVNYNKLFDAFDSKSIEASTFRNAVYGAIATAHYQYKSNTKLNPFDYSIIFEHIKTPSTLSFGSNNIKKFYGEINKVFHFSKMSNYMSLRAFTGFIFGNNNSRFYNYRASGNNGQVDYKYEKNLLARNESLSNVNGNNYFIGARTLMPNFGGLRAPAVVASRGSLQAINLEYNFKRKFPINLYFDASFMNNPDGLYLHKFNYVGGINFNVIKNYIAFSLPIIYSADIANYMDIQGIKKSKANTTNYNPFKDWHRLIVFRVNLSISQEDILNAAGF